MMAAILVLLAYALAAVLGAPLLLTKGRWSTFRPRISLLAWHVAFVSGLLALATSALLTVSLAMGYYDAGSGRQAGFRTVAVVVFAWGTLAGLGALSALVFAKAEPLNEGKRQTYEQLALIAAIGGYRTEDFHGVPVVFLACDTPIATGLPGATPQIVIASCLEEALEPAELAAVIAHESAHLRMHHAWVAQLAHLNAVCLPWLTGAREFERSTQLLIELIADDASIRRCGAVALCGALRTLAELTGVDAMTLRARRVEVARGRRDVRVAFWNRVLQI